MVIDESHNFRNGGKVTADEDDENLRENRLPPVAKPCNPFRRKNEGYLCLSATPVNNRFNDLKNQLALAYEGEADQINALLNTSSTIDDIFRQAQAAFNRWSNLPDSERTTKSIARFIEL